MLQFICPENGILKKKLGKKKTKAHFGRILAIFHRKEVRGHLVETGLLLKEMQYIIKRKIRKRCLLSN